MKISKEEEAVLVEDLLAGKAGAARRFYDGYYSRLQWFVRGRAQTEEDMEEICQDVFLAAIDSLPLYAGRARLFSWMCGIARHEISDYYRKKRLKQVLLSAAPLAFWLLATS